MNYQRPVTTWLEFTQRWSCVYNFFLSGELTSSFDFDLPPLEQLVEEVRRDEGAIFRTGTKQDEFDLTQIPEAKTMDLEKLFQRSFVLAHFALAERLGGKGQVFDGIQERWLKPWEERLAAQGFTWERIFPILFVSGPHSATQYHMDYTHQLAWQRYGTKHFHGLKNPDHWTTPELRGRCELKGMVKPAAITEADVYTLVQPPDTMLWNAAFTPHWVETFDKPAATLTLAHASLRHHGQLCPHAVEFFAYQEKLKATNEKQAAGNY